MKLTKFIQLLFLPVLFLIFTFSFTTPTQASCSTPAYCDAPAGECSYTCNGGETCIIAQGDATRTCDELITYEPCQQWEIEDAQQLNPYGDCADGTRVVLDETCEVSDTQCIDSIWESCCTPGIPAGTCGDGVCEGTETCGSCESDCGACVTEWCGDGTCNNGESCSTCAGDCGSCNVCGDGVCTGGESCLNCEADCNFCAGAATCTNGTCDADESCSNCPGDCGLCTTCGDGSCNGTETCSTCASDCGSCLTCGDGICSAGETCSSCATDCGSCAGSFCGDFSCDAFETCADCEADCGACAENAAWFQIRAGNVGSGNSGGASVAIQSQITDTSDCVAPACVRSLITEDLASTALTDGFAVVGSGTIDANGLITGERSENIYSSNTTKSRYQEKYAFFYRNSGLTSSPTSDFTGSETDALKPTYNASDIVYFQSGDLTIQTQWSIASGETYVVFVDGNLTLTDGGNDQLIDVAEGGFLAFIVSGNIVIDESLGNTTLSDTTANVEGVFIADGTFTTASRGAAAGGDDRFIGEGVFVGWSGVNLNRDFADGLGRSTENNDKAIETFVYRPDFLVNMPDIMLVPIRIWQETN